MNLSLRRLRKAARNLPGMLRGFNIHADTDKLRLIDEAFRIAEPAPRSFADLGGVWKVNGAYSLHALRKRSVDRGVLVDTDFPTGLYGKLAGRPRLRVIRGDFATPDVAARVGKVDVIFLFDVLLHQANPSWDAVLSLYAAVSPCLLIYNQQYVLGDTTVRLTALPLERYLALAPRGREEVYRQVYARGDEIHPVYGKPWRDVHNVFQWGITDRDLRARMKDLGFREAVFHNLGRFSDLPAFENHAFIFVRDVGAVWNSDSAGGR